MAPNQTASAMPCATDMAPAPDEPPVFRPVGMLISESERCLAVDKICADLGGLNFATNFIDTQGQAAGGPCPDTDAPESPPLCPRHRRGPAAEDSLQCAAAEQPSVSRSQQSSPSAFIPCELRYPSSHSTSSSDSSREDSAARVQRPQLCAGGGKRVRWGEVTVHEAAAAPPGPPPNVMNLGGREWTYDHLVRALRSGCTSEDGAVCGPALPLKTRKHRLRTFHNSFKGTHLVEWVLRNTPIRDREEAAAACRHLVANHVIERCDHQSRVFADGDDLYRLWEDSRHVQNHVPHEHVLNGQKAWVGSARHPMEVVENLLLILMGLYTKAYQDPYALIRCPEFGEFTDMTGELQSVELTALESEEDRSAFFVNLYNTLALHARALHHQVAERSARELFFNKLYYNVGGELFALNDIEHGVLRGNGAHLVRLAGWGQGTRRFSKGDSRQRWVVAHPAPETCFAVQHLCADSCPVRTYAPEGLAAQLSDSCDEVLKHSVRVREDGVTLPKACKHIRDALGDEGLLDFVKRHVSAEQRAAIERLRKARLHFTANVWHSTRPLVHAV
eukprot:TRINITY_DN16066_c0_g4_i1.p1 TRINITY_DN16066_c0_g4~~TRINITY_DN16066_c0_g4_i1.p1  ORF type:complete len:561 (+),score=166.09 TRINITY_DN16066_c0_g4_i1:301-1983(+)